MSPALRVLTPGLLTTVQDFGRPGLQHLGVPVGGALDPVSLAAANALAGNAPNAAALEVAYLGPTLLADADDVRLAIVGAPADMLVLPDAGARTGRRVAPGQSFRLRRGECLRIGSLVGGAVHYVAVEGGFDIPPILGSASTCMRGGFGGLDGRALRAGDRIPLCQDKARDRGECRLDGLVLRPPTRFRAIVGPQADFFSESEIAAFFAAEYTVSHGSDRMGMRLRGPGIRHAHGYNITSDAIAPGAVQVPGDGQPIVLLADRQTTGGYPKIATVISADLPALGRLAIGARFGFAAVGMEEAETARRAHVRALAEIPRLVKPVGPTADDLAQRLNDNNLIDGFIRAVA
jgi:biotin-dependent carboxylase-like uncharacterized protein